MRAILLWPLLACLALPVWADARMTVLVDVLKLREVAQILRVEGQVYAQEVNADMLGGAGGTGWNQQVDAIYDPDRMVEVLRSALEVELQGDVLEDTISFFASPLGTRIVTLENAARKTLADQAAEDAARARYVELSAAPTKRLTAITDLAEAGDMINRNVTTAMNANFQFLRGLADSDVVDSTEEEILADVSDDLDAITQDTTTWLFGFFLLAYDPLSDAEVQRYIDFSKTEAGMALNRALFAGFGKAYEDISYALGQAVGLNMLAEEL